MFYLLWLGYGIIELAALGIVSIFVFRRIGQAIWVGFNLPSGIFFSILFFIFAFTGFFSAYFTVRLFKKPKES